MIRRLVLAATFYAAVSAQNAKVPGWFLSGRNARDYAIHIDNDIRHSGKASAGIECKQKRCSGDGFGPLMQTFNAVAYRGQRLRLTAWVKASKADTANIWMRVDGPDGMLTFDNMSRRQAHGTFEWKRQQIVLDVPDDALTINYGLILAGSGQAWVDDFFFEEVDRKVRSTNTLHDPITTRTGLTQERFLRLPESAVNPDFEASPGT